MRVVGIIPARLGSSRFPGKPLTSILGRPMIEHVYKRSALCSVLDDLYVATCDEEIRDAVIAFGGQAVMTSDSHQRASDRTAEAMEKVGGDVVVMVQGDEPMVRPEMIAQAVEALEALTDPRALCVNVIEKIESEGELLDPNTVKVVQDLDGYALYFSRSPIPSEVSASSDTVPKYRQVCVIPFTSEGLATFNRLPPTPLERVESIDMLRLLEHGYKVRLVETPYKAYPVDVPADAERVSALLEQDPLMSRY